MLTALSIDNYALIEHLDVSFDAGMTTITGETGAGKSILLGALSLVLGKRADRSALKNNEKKCVIEAEFNITSYGLQSFFDKQQLDYVSTTIIRREINPSGKSRAFVNDTPVNLDVLEHLANDLIDIHSQHQTLMLTKTEFQFQVLDALAGNLPLVEEYQKILARYRQEKKELEQLQVRSSQAQKDRDYNQFLFNELESAALEPDMLAPLEARVEELSSIQDIQQSISGGLQMIEAEEIGLLHVLSQLRMELKIAIQKSSSLEELPIRLENVYAELTDIHSDLQLKLVELENDPQALNLAEERLQFLYSLLKKHQATHIADLIEKKIFLGTQLEDTEHQQERILELEKRTTLLNKSLVEMGLQLRKNRLQALPNLVEKMESLIAKMGMHDARFQIELSPSASFLLQGQDEMQFFFSANRGGKFGLLKNVASGGELSRIMLAIKALLSQYKKLPTIIFDEIDTGVSGPISDEIAHIMSQMASYMQVFTITHLPQVAAKGNQHFKVFKKLYNEGTQTQIKELNRDDRIAEIAKMVSGKELTTSALDHAKELLN